MQVNLLLEFLYIFPFPISCDMNNPSVTSVSSTSHVPETALQAVSLSQFVFSSTNGLTVAAIILVIISNTSNNRVQVSSLWLLVPLGICVLVTTLTSFYRVLRRNELGATLAQWRKSSGRHYKVLRRGAQQVEISLRASQLVPGDVVLISEKQIVPADMQIVKGVFKIDEGGTVVEKAAAGPSSTNSANFLFKGSKVIEGSGKGLVIYCGDETATSRKYDSALQGDLKYFYKRVVSLTFITSIVFGLIGQLANAQAETQYSLGDKTPIILYLVAGIVIASVPSLLTVSLVTALGISERYIRKTLHLFLAKLDLVTSLASMGVVVVGSTKYLIDKKFSEGVKECDAGQDPDEFQRSIDATLGAQDISSLEKDSSTHSIKATADNGVQYMCTAETELVFYKKDMQSGIAIRLGSLKPSYRVAEEVKVSLSRLRKMGIEIIPVFESNDALETKDSVERILRSAGLLAPVNLGNIGPVEEGDVQVGASIENQDQEMLVEESDSDVSGPDDNEPIPQLQKIFQGRQMVLLSSANLKGILESGEVGFCNVNLIQKLRIVASLKHTRHGSTVGFIGGNDPGDRMGLLAAHIGFSSQVFLGRSSDALIALPEEQAFPAITKAVVEARRCVANIRRSLMFLLLQIVPRLVPLIFTLAFFLPTALPLTLLLAGCLVIDLPIALALIRDPAEYDVAFRKPRNETRERIISEKMILIAMVLLGPIAALAGFVAYFQTFSDFGFNPSGMFGISRAGVVKFDAVTNSSSEPGFPSTSGFPFILSLDVYQNLHLCGRVGDVFSQSPTGHTSIAVSDRCSGPLFTIDDFNLFCYATANSAESSVSYNAARQDIVALYTQQKSVAGVIFQRNTTAGFEGLPVCGPKNADGIYVPWGFYTTSNQPIIDAAFADYKCSATETIDATNGLTTCFTTSALKFAQSAYWAAITLFAVFAAILLLRTEVYSFFHIGFINSNWVLLGAIALSMGLTLLSIYVPALNDVLDTRALPIANLFSPAIPFIILAFTLDELRRRLIRRQTPFGLWLRERTMW
jgi:magnesium-transporting ATPase (P-type)